jgi:phosphatidylglycerol:prolipoprotein diacylglycerol transferase
VILTLAFPAIDPVALQIGPLAIRWYALAYIAGLLLGWRYCRLLARRSPYKFTPEQIDDFLFWAILGVILGGRLGYVLFYNPAFYLAHPLDAFAVWRGGMSFHGGFMGMLIAVAWFTRKHKIPFLALSDIIVCAAPIGLFLGRIANFINGELYGRAGDVPWAMVFPSGGPEPRHPSQLYEAGMEGVVLFVLLWALAFRARALRIEGLLSGAFLAGYALFRVMAEVFRQPDAQLGFLIDGLTMGQVLSVPLLIGGLWLLARAGKPES